jgi:hypothetical protein
MRELDKQSMILIHEIPEKVFHRRLFQLSKRLPTFYENYASANKLKL